MSAASWLTVTRGDTPLLVSLPHTGTDLAGLEPRLVSPWLARKDADWHIERLYGFAGELGATVVRTEISRTVIDVNRDPSGASLYPGQATTGLCPLETFDGEPLYVRATEPDSREIAERKAAHFDPYHHALREEVTRLHAEHGVVALYDCHAIRSIIPRLFDAVLPEFNLGTNSGGGADPALIGLAVAHLRASGRSYVVDGRFKGGWITRSFGEPARGVHALQTELACRAYMREPVGPVIETNWPPLHDSDFAAATAHILRALLIAIRDWARETSTRRRQTRGRP